MRSIGLLLLFAALALAPGCATGGDGGDATPPPNDAVSRSLLREEAIELLLGAAASQEPLMRANAIEALQRVPSRVAPAARLGLEDENLGVRYVAAVTAGKLELESAVPGLRALLDDPSPSVRAAAIYALRRMGKGVDPTPIGSLLQSGDARQRARAAYLLGELGDASAIPMLRDAASRDIPTATLAGVRLFRLQVAEAMAKLGDNDAYETVRAALYPSRPEELEAAALAAQIIGQIGDRRAIDQLIYLIEREGDDRMPAEVRLAAAASLAPLGLPRGSFVADEYVEDENPALRAQAAAVYGRVGDPASLPMLERLMDDEAGFVRVAAADAVLRITEGA